MSFLIFWFLIYKTEIVPSLRIVVGGGGGGGEVRGVMDVRAFERLNPQPTESYFFLQKRGGGAGWAVKGNHGCKSFEQTQSSRN